MKTNRNFPLALIAAAILAGCGSVPQNSSLADAHSSYNDARNDPKVSTLAAVELKDAGNSLGKADTALSKGEGSAKVEQWAYIAKQQVGIAQETAKRKTAEMAVNNAGAKRNEVRLEARTAEADAAKQQVAMTQQTVDQQAEALIVANANADQQAAALANANANAERDQVLIAQQEQQLRELNAKKTERGMVITLADVLFRIDHAELEAGGVRNVQKLADFLNKYPQRKVLIEGHTDSTGSSSHNQALSDRRANTVQMELIHMGVSSDRVSTRGYGEEFPVASNDNAAGRQLNRRVEIVLSDANGNIAPR